MNKIEKGKVVESYRDLFSSFETVLLVKNKGLTVSDSKAIRGALKASNAKFTVVKNNLAKIALKGTDKEGIKDMFLGPISIAYSKDPVAVSKVLARFCNEEKPIEIIGGAVDGETYDREQIIALSKLPSHEELQAKIVGLIQSVPTKIALILKEPGSKIARVIKAYANK